MADVVTSNISEVLTSVKRVRDQIPYATSLCINRTAEQTQEFEVQRLPAHFTLRNQWWKPRMKLGINRTFARKDKPEAEVFSRAPFLRIQEDGGIKTPKGKKLIIPIVGGARPTATSVVNKRLKPKPGQTKIFFIKKLHGVFTKVRGKLKMLFTMASSAKVKGGLGFEKSGQEFAQKKLNENWPKAYEDALKSAK